MPYAPDITSEMKKSKHPRFNNIHLKRWLLKVGRARRRFLLRKFKDDLARLGLTEPAVRQGLLQLSKHPFVKLTREPTIQVTSHCRMGGPRLKGRERSSVTAKEFLCTHDSNNNYQSTSIHVRNVECDIYFTGVSYSSSYSQHSKLHSEQNTVTKRSVETIKLDSPVHECSRSGGQDSQCHSVKKTSQESNLRSGNNKGSQKRSRRRIRSLRMGDNPNKITWRIMPLDEEVLPKPPNLRDPISRRLAEKNRRKHLLCAKYLEIFGSHVYSSDSDFESDSTATFTSPSKTVDAPAHTVCSNLTPSPTSDLDLDNRLVNTISSVSEIPKINDRRSPILGWVRPGKKKQRVIESSTSDSDGTMTIENKAKTTLVVFSTHYTSSETCSRAFVGTSTTESDESIDRVQDDDTVRKCLSIPLPSSCTAVDMCGQKKFLTPEHSTMKKSTEAIATSMFYSDESGTGVTMDFGTDKEVQEGVAGRGLWLSTNDDRQLCTTTIGDAEIASPSIVPSTQNLIVNFNATCDKLDTAISVTKEAATESESFTNCAMSHSSDVFKVDTEPRGNDTLHTKDAEINSTLLAPDLLVARNLNVESDVIDQRSNRYTGLEHNDPNPSSTTGLDLCNMSATSCTSAKLLCALDNVFLVLLCRRRVRERQRTASRLAIQQNRIEEIRKAQHEYDSRLAVLRNELCYLFEKLHTWDQVLHFICKGLEHRITDGIEPFKKAEVELAIREANLINPCGNMKKELVQPVVQLDSKVICIIDLTDNEEQEYIASELCDSSTDPPRSQTHIVVDPNVELNTVLRKPDVGTNLCKCDLNSNKIPCTLPCIADVKTISCQQFEKIEEKSSSSLEKEDLNDSRCEFCAGSGRVACGQCYQAIYCSKSCQELHWELFHHTTCIPSPRDYVPSK